MFGREKDKGNASLPETSEEEEDPKQKARAAAEDKMIQFRRDHPRWYHVRPENPTFLQRLVFPFYDSKFYLVRIYDNFGIRFLVYLVSVYLMVKGFTFQLIYYAQIPYFLTYMNVSSTNYQIFQTVASVPWSMKPFWGIVSDTFPIFGYHKRSYIVIATMLGVTSFFILSFADLTAPIAPVAAIMFFFGNLQISVVDLLSEAKYAEMMAAKPETSSDVVSWVWGWYSLGGLIATWVVGPVGNAFSDTRNIWILRIMFIVSLPLLAQIIIFVCLGWNGDERLPVGQRGPRYEKLRKFKKPFILGMIIGTLALGVAVISMVNGYVWYNELAPKNRLLPVFAFGVFCGVVMIGLAFWAFPRPLANVVTYLFIATLLYINISGALTTFYTASEACIPGGPHFSNTYFITLSGTVSSIFSVVGVIAFQSIMSGWHFRPCFWVSTVLADLAGVVDIIMIKRWNIVAHIPDKVMYMLGDNIVLNILTMINYMPSVVLISKMCPKGMESTMYALLAAYSNFGGSVSSSIGIYIQQAMGVILVESGPCDYKNLALLTFICHIIVPLFTIPLTFVFIPDACLTDSFEELGQPEEEGVDGIIEPLEDVESVVTTNITNPSPAVDLTEKSDEKGMIARQSQIRPDVDIERNY